MSDGKFQFKGTPGAWKVGKPEFTGEGRNKHGFYPINASSWLSFIRVFKHEMRTDKEATANANLIAAAPDLLDACIDMVDKLCGEQEADDELKKGLGAPIYYSMLSMRAAIHKALNL